MRKNLVAIALAGCASAYAAPYCNVPAPPSACEARDPGDPTPLLPAPFVNGGGYDSRLAFHIAVTPPFPVGNGTPNAWSGVEVQKSAGPSGPWSAWKSLNALPSAFNPITHAHGYYFQAEYWDTAPAERCIRARLRANGKVSAWSDPKCMGLSAQPSGLRMARYNGGVVATWNDASTTDQAYVVEYGAAEYRNRLVLAGTNYVTGSMQTMLPNVNGLSLVCATIYAIEPSPAMWTRSYDGGVGTVWLPRFLYDSPLARLNNSLTACSFGV